MNKRNPQEKVWRGFALVGFVGIDLSFTTFGGFWLGRALDRWLHSDPTFLIIGVLVGLGAGIYLITRMIKLFIGEG